MPQYPPAIHLLFVAANPRDTEMLQLKAELRAIRESFPGLDQEFAASYADLQGALGRHRPHIVHFAGHGAQGGVVLLEDERDQMKQPVEPARLGELFGLLSLPPHVAFLNACWLEEVAQVLTPYVPYVISMAGSMEDQAAQRFARHFYRYLAAGEGVATAFELAKNELSVAEPDYAELPCLLAWENPPPAPWLVRIRVSSGPVDPATLRARRNREALLANVRNVWITNGLHTSLQEVARIRLNLRYAPEAVRLCYELRTPRRAAPVPAETSLLHLFEEGGRALLVLGAPGSGKTFTLLELAEALLIRAERDETQRIPVVFPLTSWADKQLPLEEWYVLELARHYGVPPEVGKAWMAQEEVLPLLDGLDEMAEAVRPACVRAINEFWQAHGLVGLAISCRKDEYKALPELLVLRTAVEIQPLTLDEADRYLGQGGPGLAAARVALQTDYALAELARNPLMLSIIALAYQGIPVKGEMRGTLEERRRRLFDTFIRRLFRHRVPRLNTPHTYLRWLKEVAGVIAARESRIFYLDDLQPFLLDQRQQRTYHGVRGLVVGMGWVLIGTRILEVVVGVILGVVLGLLEIIGDKEIKMVDRFAWIRPGWRRLREQLGWGLVGGLIIGLFFGLGGWLDLGLGEGLIVGLAMGLVLGLGEGLGGAASRREVAMRHHANEVIKSSIYYMLRKVLIGGLALGLPLGLGAGLEGLIVGFGGATIGVLMESGQPIWHHFLLRTFLAHSGRLPFRLVTFLDDAHDRLFLRRVGGGYRFYHALLQDHIQGLDVENFDFTGEGSETG